MKNEETEEYMVSFRNMLYLVNVGSFFSIVFKGLGIKERIPP